VKRFFLILLFVLLSGALGWLWWDTRPAVRLSQTLGDIDVNPDESDSVTVIERIVVRDPVRPPKVPDQVVFAGDTIRFDRGDLRERMDRELIAFTYSHSNTLLMLKRAGRIFRRLNRSWPRTGSPTTSNI